MKKLSIFLVFNLLIVIVLSAQEVVPYHFDEKKAMKLDEAVIRALCENGWSSVKQYYIKENEIIISSENYLFLKLNSDHTFKSLGEKRGANAGTWQVYQDKILHLTADSAYLNEYNKLSMAGSFAIFGMTSAEVVLVKNITSQLNAKWVFYFKKSEDSSKLAWNPKPYVPVHYTPKTAEELAAWQEKRMKELEQMNKAELLNGLKEDLFMRNIKAPQNLEERTREELLDIRIKMIKGEYRG